MCDKYTFIKGFYVILDDKVYRKYKCSNCGYKDKKYMYEV